uniref:Uncharacterized protein n=1 Tax=Steinernema glaseri TaxID=37863 RepID=A0A1I8ADE3_9BILA
MIPRYRFLQRSNQGQAVTWAQDYEINLRTGVGAIGSERGVGERSVDAKRCKWETGTKIATWRERRTDIMTQCGSDGAKCVRPPPVIHMTPLENRSHRSSRLARP